jgi:hypothetical protein
MPVLPAHLTHLSSRPSARPPQLWLVAPLAGVPIQLLTYLTALPARPVAARADGVVETDGRTFLELEDLTRNYRRPSIIDIKVGFRTWYPSASQTYIERCQ